jgi:hypothetical protein
MTDIETTLRAMEERCEAATPGPWRTDMQLDGRGARTPYIRASNNPGCRLNHPVARVLSPKGHDVRANGDFIAHSRTDLPRLIAAARELHEAFGNAMEYNAKGRYVQYAIRPTILAGAKQRNALTGNNETTGTESER